ncbi:MAG: hypothetical protein ACYCV4_05975 [Dermatophilaceae bacterium]
MYTALVSAGSSTESGFRVTNLLILIALFVIAWPLFRRLRKAASKNRKHRWVEEGLMDPPSAGAESGERPE